jgi:hypothetical protein
VTAAAAFVERYAVVPDLRGPRIRLGIAWALVLAIAVVAGSWPLAILLGLTAALAALQTTTRWQEAGTPTNQWLAAGGAAAMVLGAAVNNTVFGMASILYAGLAVAYPTGFDGTPSTDVLGSARRTSATITSGWFVGLAGGAAVQVGRVDSVALFFLLAAVSTYDAGDFLCSEGTRNRYVGPLAGMAGIGVVTGAMYFAEPEPFTTGQTIAVGAMLAVLCPAGQLFGSWLLPRARAHAPALRRLDSWLLAAPACAVAAWIAQP